MIVTFIDSHRYTIESIITALASTNAKIAVSSYYAFKTRRAAAHTVRDQRLATRILEVYTQNYSCYGG